MTFVTLKNDTRDPLDVVRQDTERVSLLQKVLDCISSEFFHGAQEPFLELRVEDLPRIDRDEGAHVRVDLTHDESVDVEELGQALHGQVARHGPVDERHALRAGVILDDRAIAQFLHQFDFCVHAWDGAGGEDSRPDEHVRRR
eukprot:CAMPEP_0185574642 /NCGR_PEP_ID=MMETSP0434-20130131/6054_1 /TAXON_ID=626734 ORGANISM="Favella taraikaensis, Strain Fe Narragansett Bay" /NCGR_SAMPLE_ID=MMETSP0434 /ASSEMBLY_ACC=CAM_ASM_000379 /LENGTH=142 /DNA_ID=CAMNT_0028191281 /DNA_START=1030 /DNA_END=1458 /DNA_ORIENTATION=-